MHWLQNLSQINVDNMNSVKQVDISGTIQSLNGTVNFRQ